MTDLTFRQFRYFDALSRHLNFGRAAAECAVSQPALSMQIADFETKLGVALVERTRHGIELTAEGANVARRVQRILGEVQDLIGDVRDRGGPLRGSLKLGVIPSIGPYVLPNLLPRLRKAHPGLKLHLRETLTRGLVSELLDGQLDLLLLALPLQETGIETLALFEDRFLLAVPRAHAMAGRTADLLEVMRGETLLLLEEGHCLRDQALDFCRLEGNTMVNTSGVSSISTIVQMVGNGYGVTLLPELAAPVELAQGKVALARFAPPEPRRIIGLAWRESSPHKPDFMACGQLIRAVAAERPEAGSAMRTSPHGGGF